MGLAAASIAPGAQVMQGGLLRGGGQSQAGRRAPPRCSTAGRNQEAERLGGGAAVRAAGLGVGRWGKAPRGRQAASRGGGSAGGRETDTRPVEKARASPTPGSGGGGGAGGGRGPLGVGEGRSRASHNNKSQPLPTPTSKPPYPRALGCTHSGRGSVRAPSGCGVGGWRVCRSLSPGGPNPARPSSGPSTRSSTPTSGFPATQANGFRKSRPILPGLGLAPGSPLSLSAGARFGRPGVRLRPREVPRFVLDPALVLHVACANCL